jgi:hypothetical protein
MGVTKMRIKENIYGNRRKLVALNNAASEVSTVKSSAN